MGEDNKTNDIEEMTADLIEYYEAAGFSDFFEKILKPMDGNQIEKFYHDTFEVEDNPELENWISRYKS